MKAIITIINDDGTILKAHEVLEPYDRTIDYNNPEAPVTEKIVFVYKIMRLYHEEDHTSDENEAVWKKWENNGKTFYECSNCKKFFNDISTYCPSCKAHMTNIV